MSDYPNEMYKMISLIPKYISNIRHVVKAYGYNLVVSDQLSLLTCAVYFNIIWFWVRPGVGSRSIRVWVSVRLWPNPSPPYILLFPYGCEVIIAWTYQGPHFSTKKACWTFWILQWQLTHGDSMVMFNKVEMHDAMMNIHMMHSFYCLMNIIK